MGIGRVTFYKQNLMWQKMLVCPRTYRLRLKSIPSNFCRSALPELMGVDEPWG
jgi:hypothetical protein